LKIDSLDEFVGPGNQQLSRRYFEIIQKEEYMVGVRSTGMPFYLYIFSGGVYLVDKKFYFYGLETEGFYDFFTRNAVTILEGEIVRHRKPHPDLQASHTYFHIIDAIVVNGEYCAMEPFHLRVDRIIKVLSTDKQSKTVFRLIRKKFFSKTELETLFSHHIDDLKNTGRFYKDERRYYRVKSLVFRAKNSTYPLTIPAENFEWKFQDSIYFSAKNLPQTHPPLRLWSLSVATDVGESEFKQLSFPADDEKRLEKDLKDILNPKEHTHNHSAIIECSYNRREAIWRYVSYEPTKKKPSKARDAMEMMVIMSENITKEELIQKFNQ